MTHRNVSTFKNQDFSRLPKIILKRVNETKKKNREKKEREKARKKNFKLKQDGVSIKTSECVQGVSARVEDQVQLWGRGQGLRRSLCRRCGHLLRVSLGYFICTLELRKDFKSPILSPIEKYGTRSSTSRGWASKRPSADWSAAIITR